ncbi:hypothetical protein FGG79_14330 [Bacillus sp. BHET2]|uniref:hypothetical protein n=1 Tax=Bacillus sp. BHET2 TaxID=2583818 RepID=UPI00110DB857|nr:hypothetical protein [Bacillus sp. BHET2]TMU85063.1 hypothetical protein FGG79_14330 [Bacillus sp. BHET2]
MFKKASLTGLATIMLVSAIAPGVSASNEETKNLEMNETEKTNEFNLSGIEGNVAITEKEKVKFEPYVKLEDNSEYVISDEAKTKLSQEEYQKLQSILDDTNIFIINNKNEDLNIIDPKQENLKIGSDKMRMSIAAFKNGKTDADTYWWGVRIYLSQYTIRAIAGGITLGGIWVPEPLVTKILATLGVVAALCPGGIQFDMNWLQISQIPNPSVRISSKFSNAKFQ